DQDRAGAEGTRAKFHPSLEPAECLPFRQRSRGGVEQRLVVDGLENRACLTEARGDVGLPVCRSEVSPLHSIEGAVEMSSLPFGQVVGDERRAQSSAGVAGRGLQPQPVEASLAQELAVGHAVQRYAARKTQVSLAGFPRYAAR